MAATEPAIRASYAKSVVGSMKLCSATERAALLARLDPALRASIREASLLDWISAHDFARLLKLVLEVLGPARARAFWRGNLLRSLDRTLLSPLRLGAVALYGESPGSLLRMAPQAWQLVGRHAGRCSTTDEPPDAFSLLFTELPAELRTPGWLPLWAGGSEACIELMKFTGSAEAELDASEPGRVVVHVRWQPRRGQTSSP